ncbi:hypothetical protein MTsDn1_25220 [Alteromonas sp. MTD1]
MQLPYYERNYDCSYYPLDHSLSGMPAGCGWYISFLDLSIPPPFALDSDAIPSSTAR